MLHTARTNLPQQRCRVQSVNVLVVIKERRNGSLQHPKPTKQDRLHSLVHSFIPYCSKQLQGLQGATVIEDLGFRA